MFKLYVLDNYEEVSKKASEVVIICSPGYSNSKMQERNKWMVDQCDVLIAVWDGTAGGTGNCVNYAQSIKKADSIIYIDPRVTP
jgi:uncharacterized phage-like protein YoqJ